VVHRLNPAAGTSYLSAGDKRHANCDTPGSSFGDQFGTRRHARS
jgi:hypothetical protein